MAELVPARLPAEAADRPRHLSGVRADGSPWTASTRAGRVVQLVFAILCAISNVMTTALIE